MKLTFTSTLLRDNPALSMMLGLCPLLAVSTTLVAGVVLALCTAGTLVVCGAVIALVRHAIPGEMRLPVFVTVVATTVTVADILLETWSVELHRTLGLFLPLIVTNCVILARAEAVASRSSARAAALDGAFMGVGFGWVLAVLGALRELLTYGTLGRGVEQAFGPGGAHLVIDLGVPAGGGLLLAATPAGAFLLLALLVALRNSLQGLGTGSESPGAEHDGSIRHLRG
jgi:Na+-translocating ferredoxin:NAD+ oxidoreductase subunit E